MTEVFIKILNMSILAGAMIPCVVLLRLVLKRTPRAVFCILWALVAVALVCPFRIETAISPLPSGEPIPREIIYSYEPEIDSGIPVVDEVVNPMISQSTELANKSERAPLESLAFYACIVWLCGVFAMLVYSAVSYFGIYSKVRASVRLSKNVFVCDDIDSPFILGIICPRIYLPSSLPKDATEFVLAHERAHIRRLDFIWKPLGFLLLSIHWFNPLVWVAYVLLCRDIELACDEKVARGLDSDRMKSYSEALLLCSVPRRMIMACPVAFGEVGVKARIRSLLNYKRPAFWVIAVSLLLCIAAAVALFTVRPESDELYIGGGIEVTKESTELDGISARVISADLNAKRPYIEVEWKSETDESYVCGNSFYIYKSADGEWNDARIARDYIVTLEAYLIPNKNNLFQRSFKKKYYLSDIRTDTEGTYRFESSFSRDGGGEKEKYNALIEFEIKKPTKAKYFKADVYEKAEYTDKKGKTVYELTVIPMNNEGEFYRLGTTKIKSSAPFPESIIKGTVVLVGFRGEIVEGEPNVIEDLYVIEATSNAFGSSITNKNKIQLNESMSFSVGDIGIRESISTKEAYGEDYEGVHITPDNEVVYLPKEGNCLVCVEVNFENLSKELDVFTSAVLYYKDKPYTESSTCRHVDGGIVGSESKRDFILVFEAPLSIAKGDSGAYVQIYFSYEDSPKTVYNIPLTSLSKAEVRPIQCYELKKMGGAYRLTINDQSGNMMWKDDFYNKPGVTILTEDIIEVSAATISKNWSRYFNVKTGEISEEYTFVLGAERSYVLCLESDEKTGERSIVVYYAFDKSRSISKYILENGAELAFVTVDSKNENGDGDSIWTFSYCTTEDDIREINVVVPRVAPPADTTAPPADTTAKPVGIITY